MKKKRLITRPESIALDKIREIILEKVLERGLHPEGDWEDEPQTEFLETLIETIKNEETQAKETSKTTPKEDEEKNQTLKQTESQAQAAAKLVKDLKKRCENGRIKWGDVFMALDGIILVLGKNAQLSEKELWKLLEKDSPETLKDWLTNIIPSAAEVDSQKKDILFDKLRRQLAPPSPEPVLTPKEMFDNLTREHAVVLKAAEEAEKACPMLANRGDKTFMAVWDAAPLEEKMAQKDLFKNLLEVYAAYDKCLIKMQYLVIAFRNPKEQEKLSVKDWLAEWEKLNEFAENFSSNPEAIPFFPGKILGMGIRTNPEIPAETTTKEHDAPLTLKEWWEYASINCGILFNAVDSHLDERLKGQLMDVNASTREALQTFNRYQKALREYSDAVKIFAEEVSAWRDEIIQSELLSFEENDSEKIVSKDISNTTQGPQEVSEQYKNAVEILRVLTQNLSNTLLNGDIAQRDLSKFRRLFQRSEKLHEKIKAVNAVGTTANRFAKKWTATNDAQAVKKLQEERQEIYANMHALRAREVHFSDSLDRLGSGITGTSILLTPSGIKTEEKALLTTSLEKELSPAEKEDRVFTLPAEESYVTDRPKTATEATEIRVEYR